MPQATITDRTDFENLIRTHSSDNPFPPLFLIPIACLYSIRDLFSLLRVDTLSSEE